MKKVFNTLSKYVGHFGAGLISIVFMLVLTVMIAVQGFAFWLTTDHGSSFLSAQLEGLVEDTPYELTLGEFELHNLFGVRAKSLRLADAQGVFLVVEDIGIDVSVLPLALRRAAVNLDARLVHLSRLPEGAATDPENDNGLDITLPSRPGVFFTTMTVEAHIEELVLSDQVPGGEVRSPVTMAQMIRLGVDEFHLEGWVDLAAENIAIPDRVAYKIAAPWEGGFISLDNARVEKEGVYALQGEGGWESVSDALDLHIFGRIEGDYHEMLDRNIDIDLTLSGTTENFTGLFAADGRFLETPFSVQTPISGNTAEIRLSDIEGSGYGFALSGAVAYNRNADIGLQGEIDARLDSLELVEVLSGIEDLSGQGQISLAVNEGAYSGTGSFTDLAYQGRQMRRLDFTISPAQHNRFNMTLEAEGARAEPFSLVANAAVDLDLNSLELESAVLSVGSGEVSLSGQAMPERLDLDADISNLRIAALPYLDITDMPLVVTEGEIAFRGNPAQPEIDASATLSGARVEDEAVALSVTANYRNSQANLIATADGQGIETLVARLALPLDLSLYPFAFDLDRSAAMTGTVRGRFDPGAALLPFLSQTQTVSGSMALDAEIGGSLGDPALSGDVTLSDGRFRDRVNGLFLDDINGRAVLAGSRIEIAHFSATDGGQGQVTASGHIDFAGETLPEVNLVLTADALRLLRGSAHRLIVDADLRFETRSDGYFITGLIMPVEAEMSLPEHFETRIPELNIVRAPGEIQAPFLRNFQLEVAIRADNQVFIRGWGLEVEVGGRLEVEGYASDPDVLGTLSVLRGRYEEFGQVFEIQRADLRFMGAIPPSPYLDILVENDMGDVNAQVRITGPVRDPEISFSSIPAMPEDEVLSYVLFGQDSAQISPFQAIQLAQTIRRFSGGGQGLDPIGQLRSLTGLDDLRIEGTGDDLTVGAGKYLTDRVYFQIEQGGRDNASAASVEIELTPHITLESKTGSSGGTGAGVFWEWSY